MSKKIKNILSTIGVIVLLLVVFKGTQYYYQSQIGEVNKELKKSIIRADKLEKVSVGYYQKLVADTLEKEELKALVEELKIEVDNPVSVEQIILKPKEEKHEIQDVEVKDSIIEVRDYYPNKENPYVMYFAKLNLKTQKYIGEFTFNRIPVTVVIGESGGLHKAHITVPDFLEVEEFDFQTVDLTNYKVDNFGLLVGAGFYSNLVRRQQGLEITAGLRYKKIYLLGSARTDSTVGLKTLIEF